MLADIEVLGHTSTIGKPARLDVAADPSASLSQQPGGFSQRFQQPNVPAGVTPSQTPGATLTGSLSAPVQQPSWPLDAPAAGSKATMQSSLVESNIQGSSVQLQGQPCNKGDTSRHMFEHVQAKLLLVQCSHTDSRVLAASMIDIACVVFIFMQNLSPCLLESPF